MMHNATSMTANDPRLDAPRGLQRDVMLAPLTTLGIGGPARFFVRATTIDELREAVAWARTSGHRLFILGGGSNLLVSDEGFDGLVLQVALRGIVVESVDRTSATIRVAAGEPWEGVVSMAVARAWAGIECLAGIPGSTGATPIQNVGAYGQDVSETIIRVEALELESGRIVTMTRDECRFGYRSSLFKGEAKGRFLVTAVTFRLTPGGQATISYPELQALLDEKSVVPSDLMRVRDAVIVIRKRKGMVLDRLDPDTRSDGSFFMNPIVGRHAFEQFLPRAQKVAGEDRIPNFPSGDEVKLSAAWLIEHAGFQKGFVHGAVGLSSKHSLAIINRGGGTAREVRELVAMIQTGVRERFGVEIQPEPNFIGF